MALGLTRREQWALLGVVGVILAGLGVQGWRAGNQSGVVASDSVYLAGQGYWQKLADFKAGETTGTLPLTTAGFTSGTQPTSGTVLAEQPPGGGMDINRATAEEFERLPMIGPAKARTIAETRKKLGGFATIDQLDQVPGIGPKTVDRLRPYLRLDTPGRGSEAVTTPTATRLAVSESTRPVTSTTVTVIANRAPASSVRPTPMPVLPAPPAPRININTASREQLDLLPGIGPAMADRILAVRARIGRFASVDDLRHIKGIGPKVFEKLAPLVTAE